MVYDSHTNVIGPIKRTLDRYSCEYKYKEDLHCVIPSFKYLIEFYLYEDTTGFEDLKEAVDSYGIISQVGTVYEKADIENADWFVINTGEYQYPQPEGDFGYLKATFDLDAYCGVCGIGKIQNAPYRLKAEPKQTKNQFWGLHWEFEAIFVRPETKQFLENEKVKGIAFSKPLLHKKNSEVESIFQLHIDTILDRGFDDYNTKTVTCKTDNEEECNIDTNLKCCGRVKFHHPQIGGYLFNKSLFNPDYEIVQTNEYFGSGGSAARLQVVSKRIKNLIEKQKLKGLSFTPIVHEQSRR